MIEKTYVVALKISTMNDDSSTEGFMGIHLLVK